MRISDKTLYRLEIKSTKVFPIVIAVLYLINTIASYFYVDIEVLSMLGGMSLLPLIKLYLSSFTYKLCNHHRIFIYYIFLHNIIANVDFFIKGIPIPDRDYFLINIILFGIFLFLYIILKRIHDFNSKHYSKIAKRHS